MVLDKTIHRKMLVNILKDIYTDPDIGPYLGFKGGTAVLLFYELDRFSVDLDFDLLDTTKEDIIFEKVSEILRQYGEIESRNKRYNIFFLLPYEGKIPGGQNIKVEINKRSFGSRYEIKQFLGLTVQVMISEDMVAHKLVAMHERIGKTNRDIFDVHFFFKHNWPVNKDIVQLRTGIIYKDFLQICVDDLNALEDRGILSGLGELLDEKQKNWVKTKLRQETIFLLNLAISNEP